MNKLISILILLLVISQASAAEKFKLSDYDQAVKANNLQKIVILRSYILGAVETHLLYSKMLRDWTGVNLFCIGNVDLNINDLGKIFEAKIISLRRRYGESIMGMPIPQAVQMIVEDQYKCYQ